MRKSPFRLVAFLALITLFSAGLNARASHSPNLDAAIDALKAAKHDEGPSGDLDSLSLSTSAASSPAPAVPDAVMNDLQNALKSLNRATNDKGGKRDEVKGLINDAIALFKSGDKDGANKKIDHAMDEIYAAANHRGGW
jgi:hypothetical protein